MLFKHFKIIGRRIIKKDIQSLRGRAFKSALTPQPPQSQEEEAFIATQEVHSSVIQQLQVNTKASTTQTLFHYKGL